MFAFLSAVSSSPFCVFFLLFNFHPTTHYCLSHHWRCILPHLPVLLHSPSSAVLERTSSICQLDGDSLDIDLPYSIICLSCFLLVLICLLFDPLSLNLFTLLTEFVMHIISTFYRTIRYLAPLRTRQKMTGSFSLGSALLTLLLSPSLFPLTASVRAPPPSVQVINPPCGPKTGGTAVYIHGENFVRSKTFCRFGEVGRLISPTLVTSSLVLCKSPPTSYLNPKRVQLQVTNDGGYTFSSDRISFFYSGGLVSALHRDKQSIV
jgi:hypothetical protein